MSYGQENQRFARQLKVGPDVFERPVVVLELPPGQERRPDALAGFMFAANQLVRMFTRLHLVSPDARLPINPWRLASLCDLKRPLSELSEGYADWSRPAGADITIGIGAAPTCVAKRTVVVSFSGWEMALDQPLDSALPGVYGALLGACYGSAQTFLHAVELAGGRHKPMKPFRLSLLDYASTGTNAATPNSVNLDVVHMVGVGAVGSAAVYALGHLPVLTGVLHLIDDDGVDDTNLNRYTLMKRKDVGQKKVDVGKIALTDSGLDVQPHAVNFDKFLEEDGRPVELLLTPVDSEAGRRHLATKLPRSIINAATGNSTVTVSRHGFADGKACLHCLYLPPVEEMTTEQLMAKDLGLTAAEVTSLLARNAPIDLEQVRRVERHRGLGSGSLHQWAGQRVQSFYQRAVCGTAPVQTATGTVVTPLSFISATAGVLLAAELVKRVAPSLSPYALDNYFRLDTFHTPNPAFRQAKLQDSSTRCICADPDYVGVYNRRFGGMRPNTQRYERKQLL